MKFHSSLAILLVAALDAVAAQGRKLRKDGGQDGRRNLKATKDSKCHKSFKAGCIGFNLQFPVQQTGLFNPNNPYFGISYGYGGNGSPTPWTIKSMYGDGVLEPIPSAVGTIWFAKGRLGKQYDDDMSPLDFSDNLFIFRQKCTVLDGEITAFGEFRTGDNQLGRVNLECELYLQAGFGDSAFVNLPDSLFLKGFTKGTIEVDEGTPNGNIAAEELKGVDDFWATVVGGTGRWAGAVGVAEVFTEGYPDDIDLGIPPANNPSGWLIDLYAVGSKEYQDLFNVAELPPKLNFNVGEDLP